MSHSTIPPWTVAMPVLGAVAYATLGANPAPWAGALLGVALIATVLAAVHHAELLAARVGDPFGAILLALAVTVIEVGLIVSIMLGNKPAPTLVRDTILAVVMLMLHAIAGACIVAGALRHREQAFRIQGAHAHLIVLIPMVALTLIIPNYTVSSPGPFYTATQLVFVSVVCLALYGAFSFTQTVRHREHFIPPGPAPDGVRPGARLAAAASVLLIVALIAVVLLAKSVTPVLQAAASAAGAPAASVGVAVAAIVLLPEALAALAAARANRLQTSINLALGSAIASIGLTIPAVAVVAVWTGVPLALGVSQQDSALLALSFLIALVTYGTGRASLLAGVVHLLLFATWLFLLFAP